MKYSSPLKALLVCCVVLVAPPSSEAKTSPDGSFFAVDPVLEKWLSKDKEMENGYAIARPLKEGDLGYKYSKVLAGSDEESADSSNKKTFPFEESYLDSVRLSLEDNLFEKDKTGSCKDFSAMNQLVTKDWLKDATVDQLKRVFLELASYRPNRKVRILYSRILSNLDSKSRKPILRNISVPQSIKTYLVSKDGSLLEDAPHWQAYSGVALASVAGSCDRKLTASTHALSSRTVALKDLLPTLLKNGSCFFSSRKRNSKLKDLFFTQIKKQESNSETLAELHALRKTYMSKTAPNSKSVNSAEAMGKSIYKKDSPTAIDIAKAFFIGRVLEDVQNFDSAIAAYSFVARYKNLLEKEWMRKNMQRLIVLLYQNKDFSRAIKFAEEYKPYARNILKSDNGVGFSRFWLARALYAQGKKVEAQRVFQDLAKRHFSSFYGAMAHAVLDELGVPVKSFALVNRSTFSKSWLYSQFSPQEKHRLDWIELLISQKETRSAICEIKFLQPRGRVEGFFAAKAVLMSLAGDYLGGIKSLAQLDHYDRSNLPQGIESVFFPIEFRSEIEVAARQAGIDPVLPISIIRQESVFNPVAVSPAGAVGLMQLMPATAKVERRRISTSYVRGLNLKSSFKRKRTNRTFLKKPENNIAIGVHHLRSLKKKYKHPVFVMTSYNASPRATKRWKENIPTEDIFYFIESIPYRETQKYVKLIFRNYFYYSQYYYRNRLSEMAMLSPVIEQAFQLH